MRLPSPPTPSYTLTACSVSLSRPPQSLSQPPTPPSSTPCYIACLETELRVLRIKIEKKPSYIEELVIDEEALQKALQAKLGYLRQEALQHDLDCVSAIHRFRRGRAPFAIESSGALFITTKRSLVQAANEFFRETVVGYGDSAVPPCVPDHVLTTLIWLKKPLAAPE